MKTHIYLNLLSIFFVIGASACNSVIAVGIEHPGSGTPSQAAPSGTLPTGTLPTGTLPTGTAALPSMTAPAPTNTATQAPAPIPTATNTPAAPTSPALPDYIDDRSTPSQLIVSYYNAINRHETLRAYNYWSDPATTNGSFENFANGYQNTARVDLAFGQITGDAGAGQVYYTVPVILKTTATDGSRANYAACYVLHKAQPDNFGAPPFNPMGIAQGQAKASDLNTPDATALASACDGFPTGANPVAASVESLSIDKSNFVDNRSGALETVSSLLNALNLKQYVRAYSYFQDPASFPGTYTTWAAGYADTESISASFGKVQSEGAAGSLYYKLPVALQALTSSNSTQTFVGCYTLRLGEPSNQATPPFQPMGIVSANFNQVDNGSDVPTRLQTACN